MNAKLKEALEALSRLPDDKQEEMAAIILEELEDDAAWDEAFANSQPQLKKLADKASEEYRAGRTEPLDPDLL